MNRQFFIYILLTILLKSISYAQKSTYQISTVAFYNLENLFDEKDDPTIFDEEYTPTGQKAWTSKKIALKIKNLTTVISQIGVIKTKLPPALLGVSEVENREILQRLLKHPNLKNIDYGIAHFNSPDRRGIDVALLYDRNRFRLTHANKHLLLLKDHNNNRVYTRDQLCVSGYLGDELIYCIVNHWPSRRGGEKRSEPKRIEAARLTYKITDSIYKITPTANIIIMGDFNDDPTNLSFKKILKTKEKLDLAYEFSYLYNPMELMKKQGLGTLAYRDKWNIFDQILFSNSILDSTGIQLYQTKIFSPKYLTQKRGKYKGYPKRSTDTEIGFSDHFPVYSYLIKRID